MKVHHASTLLLILLYPGEADGSDQVHFPERCLSHIDCELAAFLQATASFGGFGCDYTHGHPFCSVQNIKDKKGT